MGTNPEEQSEKVRGIVQLTDRTIEIVSDVAYGDAKKRRSVYPLVLVLLATVALLAVLLADADLLGLVGLVSLVLLGIWVGGSGR